jgi:ribokinase
MSDLIVLGSMNVDITVRVPHLPAPGETVIGADADHSCGGKGGNQAASMAKIAAGLAPVRMVARVGNDDHGAALVSDQRARGVDVSDIRTVRGVGTGLAQIAVDPSGENTIAVSPGANAHWRTEEIDELDIRPGDVVVCQLEIPLWVVRRVAERSRNVGARIILNAAPPHHLTGIDLDERAVLVLNESEASVVLGTTPTSPEHLEELATHLRSAVVVTLGAQGVLFREPGQPASAMAAFPVNVVSTVGAGDAFVGALAVALLQGFRLPDAVRRGCAAGALATTAEDARGALPNHEHLEDFMEAVSC